MSKDFSYYKLKIRRRLQRIYRSLQEIKEEITVGLTNTIVISVLIPLIILPLIRRQSNYQNFI